MWFYFLFLGTSSAAPALHHSYDDSVSGSDLESLPSSDSDSSDEEKPTRNIHLPDNIKEDDGVRFLLGHPEAFLDDKIMAMIRKAPLE